MSKTSKKYSVGERFQVSTEKGTIRYIGPIQHFQNEVVWVGVEWDNEIRGKHDGQVKNVRYFQARTEKAGSFIKYNQFVRKVKSKCGLLDAIKMRYQDTNDEDTGALNEDMTIEDDQGNKITVEFVGKKKIQDKISVLDNLVKISVDNSLVGFLEAENEETERSCYPNLRELDLSNTLVSFWDDVVNFVARNKSLNLLNLSENVLSVKNEKLCDSWTKCDHLKSLVLNSCRIVTTDLFRLSSSFHNLEELFISKNKFHRELENFKLPKTKVFPNLKVLNISENKILSFTHVYDFISMFVNLDTLILSDNIIEMIPQHDSKMGSMKLKKLVINKNRVSEITSVDNISLFFPELEFLIIHDNPFETANMTTKKESNEQIIDHELNRIIIISKIENLKGLNKSEVSKEERKECEKYFVKRYLIDKPKKKCSKRDNRLKEMHHEIIEYEIKKRENAKTTKGNMNNLQIFLICGDKRKRKKIKQTLKIGQLKLMIKRVFKIDLEKHRIYYLLKTKKKDDSFIDVPVEFEDNEHVVSYYCLVDGQELFVEPRDVSVMIEEKRKKEDEINSRIREKQEFIEKSNIWKQKMFQ